MSFRYMFAAVCAVSWSVFLMGCVPPNAQHKLTVLSSPPGAGTIEIDPVRPVYPAGAVVTLNAVPAEGWTFLRWDAVGVNTTQQSVQISMFSDMTATALFVPFDTTVQPVVQDSGFEAGADTSFWTQTSGNYDSLICSVDTCEFVNDIGPHAGQHWATFGNAADGAPENASLSQLIGMPINAPIFLQFFLAVPAAESSFIFQVLLGETVVFELTEAAQSEYAAYKLVSLDISQFAGMDPQLLSFNYQNALTGENSVKLFLDDVILLAQGG